MSIALDVGTHHVRSLRREGGRLVGRTNRPIYVSFPDRPAQRRILEKASIRFATCQGGLLLIGQSAVEAAEMLETPCIPLLIENHLPEADPVARQVLTTLIDCLLPRASTAGEFCWMTVPGSGGEDSPEARFFSQLVRLRGYLPRIVHPGMAVVLAELGHCGFSGIGCDFGSGYTRSAFIYQAVERSRACHEKGAAWIDAKLAEAEGCILWDREGNQYLNSEAIARWRNSSLISVLKPITEREQRLALLCEQLIAEALQEIQDQLSRDRVAATLRAPIPIVCSGGLTRLPGFVELVREMLREASLSSSISDVLAAPDPDYTVARGCLILAELDQQTVRPKVA
jgi:hypothetical protein